MIFGDVQLTAGEDILAEALFLAGHDKLLVFLEVEFVGGVYQSILSAFDQQKYLVIRLQLSIKEFTEVRYLKKIFFLDFLNLQLSFGFQTCALHVVVSGYL